MLTLIIIMLINQTPTFDSIEGRARTRWSC